MSRQLHTGITTRNEKSERDTCPGKLPGSSYIPFLLNTLEMHNHPVKPSGLQGRESHRLEKIKTPQGQRIGKRKKEQTFEPHKIHARGNLHLRNQLPITP